MGTSWNSWQKSQPEIQNTTSWEQSTFLWRASNILTWSLSTVVGFSQTFCGAIRSTVIIGRERKINFAEQFGWQWLKSYKVLMNGESKIDLEKNDYVCPKQAFKTLTRLHYFASSDIAGMEETTKHETEQKLVTGVKTETYGTHVLTCMVGGSDEHIEVGNKTIAALAGSIALTSGVQGVTIQSGGGRIQVLPTEISINAPTINIG